MLSESGIRPDNWIQEIDKPQGISLFLQFSNNFIDLVVTQSLRSLKLKNNREVTNLNNIFSLFPLLEKIDIQNCFLIGDKQLCEALEKNPNNKLKHLNVKGKNISIKY